MSPINRWSDEEVGLLADTMARPIKDVCAQLANRTPHAVATMRKKIKRGWTRQRSSWTEHEDSILRTYGAARTSEQLISLLPGRTASAIQTRRNNFGIATPRGTALSPMVIGTRRVLAKTCTSCGLLLSGEWFPSKTKGGTSSWCRFCYASKSGDRYRLGSSDDTQDKAAERRRQYQRLTEAAATRSGMPYLDEDFRILSDESLTLVGKALRTGRTYAAVSRMCSVNNYRSSGSKLDDSASYTWRIDNPNADRIDEITASLKQEFETAGVPFPAWDWDDEDLKETA